MKLSPPASSSDIELAREVARRLHQRRRREDRPEDRPAGPAPTTRAPWRPAVSQPAPPPPAAQHVSPPPPPPPPAPQAPPRAPAPPERSHAGPKWAEEPAPPSWDSIPVDLPRDPVEDLGNKEPEDALDALTTPEPPSEAAAASSELDEERVVPPAPAADPARFDEADAYGGSPEASPFDGADTLDTPDLDEPEPGAPGLGTRDLLGDDLGADDVDADDLGSDDLGAAALGASGPSGLPEDPSEEEELFDEGLGPSWGDVVESCMSLAHARGALLADAAGELVAARGEWPDPGAEAIASKLVAMMDRTLKDAPTRSVSAPVGGLHLTAWRVPVGDRLLTAAFIAESPVRAETRPSIDLEVQRGAAA